MEGKFPPTRWSLVSTNADQENEQILCQLYWRPIFVHLRQRAWSREDAEDLTQSFFLRLTSDRTFFNANQEKGKLRTFLLGALQRHLADHLRYTRRQKRGGNAEHLPLAISESDFEDAEHRYVTAVDEGSSPEDAFDQAWARDLLTRTHQRIASDYDRAGKSLEYETLKPALTVEGSVDTATAGKRLGIKQASVRVLVHRLR
ncbi:MAG: DNA-directed RNA polymerase specialized sigma24 family protein, partial [Akkermansiaceae bacterium]